MNAVEDLLSSLDLVAEDLCEAHAADRMLTKMANREDRAAEFAREVRSGLQFIGGSLAFRMALAVNRTLQGPSNDKASFARLLKLAKTASHNADLSGFEKRLDELRNGPTARKLQQCRNGFMAHTLTGALGSRDGIKSHIVVADLLYELTDLYVEIHRAATGAEDRVVRGDSEKWRTRAQETWDTLLGAEDADEDAIDQG